VPARWQQSLWPEAGPRGFVKKSPRTDLNIVSTLLGTKLYLLINYMSTFFIACVCPPRMLDYSAKKRGSGGK